MRGFHQSSLFNELNTQAQVLKLHFQLFLEMTSVKLFNFLYYLN